MDNLIFVLAFLAALSCGLMAGLFFAFSVTVMQALGRQPAANGIAVMQAINVVIINPVFLLAFFGPAVACLLVILLVLTGWPVPGGFWLIAGSLFYLLGTFGVTILFNVPKNNRLAAMSPGDADSAGYWTEYLRSWTAWNHVRTVAALTALALLMIGIQVL